MEKHLDSDQYVTFNKTDEFATYFRVFSKIVKNIK